MLPRQGEKLGEGHLAADAGGDEDAGQWSVDGRWSMVLSQRLVRSQDPRSVTIDHRPSTIDPSRIGWPHIQLRHQRALRQGQGRQDRVGYVLGLENAVDIG